MSSQLQAQPAQRPSALSTLLGALRRAGWHDVTPADPYTTASAASWWEPIRARGARGHTPARVVVVGGALGYSSYLPDGSQLEQVSWAWVSPHNLASALAYITDATEQVSEERAAR